MLRTVLVNCLLVDRFRRGLGKVSDLPSQFQKFPVQCVILLRCLLGDFFDPESEPPLSDNGGDRQDRSG